MSEAPSSDAMKNLVRFIVCLAIAGALVALIVYFFGVLPGQEAALLQVPKNC